jgi:zinc protease
LIAKGLPAGVSAITAVEGIQEYQLANGLRVLLCPDRTKETVTVNVTYLVGSRHENYGETGMAHLLEHLLFKGTPSHPKIHQELTEHGCRANGTTSFDRTNYFETFPATPENVAWALDLEADRMVNSNVARTDLDSEMTVVRNEFEQDENNPREVLQERMLSSAFLWHNYGKSTIGARSDIENVSIERLQAFYRSYYQPDNAILIVAGAIDPNATLEIIANTFGKIPRPGRALPPIYTTEPAQDGERSVTLRRVGDTPVVALAYHVPPGSHPDYPAVEILRFILADTPSGRLHKALVETGAATGVGGWAYALKDPGVALFSADMRLDGAVEAVMATMTEVVEAVPTTPLAAEEVERARAHELKDWDLTLRNTERLARTLSEWAAMGDWRLMFVHRDRMEAVKPADVSRVASAYLRRNNRTSGVYVPTTATERVAIPAAPALAGIVDGYRGRAEMAAGEEFDATPATIESRVQRSALASGLKLVLLPKKTRGQAVNAALTLRLGDEGSLKGQAEIGNVTGDLLMHGTVKRSRQEVEDEIDRLRSRISAGGGPTEVSAAIETDGAHLAAALRLLAEILREPAFPSSEFELVKEATMQRIESSKSDPGQVAGIDFGRHMAPWPKDDVRYVATPEERLAALDEVTLSDVKEFYGQFYGASAGELVIVGDFEPGATASLAQELFGSWDSRRPYVRLASPYQDRPAVRHELETPDKEGAVFRAGQRIALRDDDPDYPALVLANFMTGGGFLSSRLATRLRQQEGLSYGTRSSFRASYFEPDASFTANAIYAPQNAARLERAFDEEIARIVSDGFTPEEVEKAKEGLIKSRAVARGRDNDLAAMLGERAHQERTLGWDGALEEKVQALTPGAVHEAVKRHLVPAKMTKVFAGDFSRVRPSEPAPAANPPGGDQASQ